MYAMTPIYIPLDLQINTLLKLPVKSLLRFRSVSKLWSSIITSQEFRNNHLNIASSSPPPSPRLLIAFEDFYGAKLLVVSIPNPNVPSSSSNDLSLVHIKGKIVYNAGGGLICVGAGFANVGICNPSTRQVHNFPDFKFKQLETVCPRPMYIPCWRSIQSACP
ncbi:hypothetical protein Bca52824_030683 [Brassica carinata]|uniref:F-box domain-containing protein n=1 Tax=Brassica carinata TaxID=52824 RepID=A0A8X7S994_BRACI|nr:hypothetical protein Bca52824_030683 [Brassica carinata]